MLNWLLFGFFGVLAYIFISIFGRFGANAVSALDSALVVFKPIPLLFIIVGNIFFSLGMFYGFQNTKYAIPAMVAVGVITAFFYSVFALGNEVTIIRVLGIALILLGIFLLK